MYSMPNYDGFDYYFSAPAGIGFAAIAIIVIFAVLLLLAVAVLSYVFSSIGMYTLAKKRGMKNAFLAFIPVASIYLLGKIADDINVTMNKKSNYGQKLLVTCIPIIVVSELYSVFAGVSAYVVSEFSRLPIYILMVILLVCLVVVVLGVFFLVYMYMCLYKIFKEYSPKKSKTMLVLSILFPILGDIFIFAIRNNKSGYQKWREEQLAIRIRNEQEAAAAAAAEVAVEAVEETAEETVEETADSDETAEENDGEEN